jgi:hypothetical protein
MAGVGRSGEAGGFVFFVVRKISGAFNFSFKSVA